MTEKYKIIFLGYAFRLDIFITLQIYDSIQMELTICEFLYIGKYMKILVNFKTRKD